MVRRFISIYFPYSDGDKRRDSRNVSIAFNHKELLLYKKIKMHNSKEIREMISISSYNQLLQTAREEDRKLSELIKVRLKEKLLNKKRGKQISELDRDKVQTWIDLLKSDAKNKKNYSELIKFLESV